MARPRKKAARTLGGTRAPFPWPPRVRTKPAFETHGRIDDGPFPFTDADRAAILTAFGRKARRTFGDDYLRQWINDEAANALQLAGAVLWSNSGLAASETRELIGDVEKAADSLLSALHALSDSRALWELASRAGPLTVLASDALAGKPIPVDYLYAYQQGAERLALIARRSEPPRNPFVGDMLPALWDNVESLQVQCRLALQMVKTDRTRKSGSLVRRLFVFHLSVRWTAYFPDPPDGRPKGLFVRVARAVAAASGIPMSARTVADALRRGIG